MLIEENRIPSKGILYALTRQKVIFMPYDDVQNAEDTLRKVGCNVSIRNLLNGDESVSDDTSSNMLLELHMFDDKTEYRVVRKRRGGYSSYIIGDSEYSDKYVETVLVQNIGTDGVAAGDGMVDIVNYVGYDENDIQTIVNYRLQRRCEA